MPTPRPAHLQRLLLFLALLPLTAQAQTPAPPPPSPIFATLTFPLDASHSKIGTRIDARVTAPWTGNGCTLNLNSLIEGHVTQVVRRSKNIPRSSLRLVFDTADCNHQRSTPLPATLIALLGPSDAASNGLGKNPPLTDTPNPIGTGAGMRSVVRASIANQYALTGRSLPSQWKIGMVVDVPMNLIVASRPENGSLVWSSKGDARLEARTTLILVAAPAKP